VFQSTRPRGARPRAVSCVPGCVPVSIHAPAGGATRKRDKRQQPSAVSIHAPAGGATTFRAYGFWRFTVSIHAPAGGATTLATAARSLEMFQSTRPRGARRRRHDGADIILGRFNPRARGGRDMSVTMEGDKVVIVSIHAPAGGATQR